MTERIFPTDRHGNPLGPAREEVVRCRDCKHYHVYTKECDRFGDLQHGGYYASAEPDGFCAWGARADA